MASKWRIDGVFWTCALKKWGQVFTRVGLLVNLYSVAMVLSQRRSYTATKLTHAHANVWFLSDERPMLETLDYTIRIGSTPIF